MPAIKVPENLWSTSIMPEGILERWLVGDGSPVSAGDPVACVRINEALHEIMSPGTGRIRTLAQLSSVVEPGTPIAEIESRDTSS